MRQAGSAKHSLPAVALALLLIASCSTRSEDLPGPVVLIGIDGLEWSVVLPLIREGRLPALEDLMRRGSFGTLSTQAPAKSPVIWTTVVTGKAPGKHGILDFTRQDENGARVLYSSADRTTKALWNILGDAGQTSAVVGWWTTFPAEPIAGVMVSQANTLERVERRRLLKPGGIELGAAGQVHPVELEDEVFGIVEQVDRELPEILRGVYPAVALGGSGSDTAHWEACRWSLRADELVRRISLRLSRASRFPDLFLAYFSTPDVVGHRFWRFHEPDAFEHPPSESRIRQLGGVIDRTYEHIDTMVGELVAELPASANVFVVSDHGMRPKRVDRPFEVDADGAETESGGHGGGPPGVLVAAGPAIRRAEAGSPIRQLTPADLPRVGNIVDLAPTFLVLRDLPIGRDMDGAVLESLLTLETLDVLAPRFVDTHDTPEWIAGQRERGGQLLPGHDERLEQLRSLGYLGGG